MPNSAALCASPSTPPEKPATVIPVRKSHVKPVPEALPPVSARGLELAARIRERWSDSVASVLDVGRMLVAAKEELPHGEFEAMIHAELPFGPRAAQMLMTIAASRVLSNPKHASLLPPSWTTLYELTKVPESDLERALKENRIHAELSRAQVSQLAGTRPGEQHERQVCPKCGDETLRRYKSVKVDLAEGGSLLPRLLARRLWVCVTEACAAGYLSEETLVSAYEKRYIPSVSTGYLPE